MKQRFKARACLGKKGLSTEAAVSTVVDSKPQAEVIAAMRVGQVENVASAELMVQ